MSIFTKISEFFSGTKSQPAAELPPVTDAPYKVETIEAKSSVAHILEFPAQKTAKKSNEGKELPKFADSKSAAKVETTPVVVKARCNAIDLKKLSKSELLDLAKNLEIKVNDRMGKAAIITKLSK